MSGLVHLSPTAFGTNCPVQDDKEVEIDVSSGGPSRKTDQVLRKKERKKERKNGRKKEETTVDYVHRYVLVVRLGAVGTHIWSCVPFHSIPLAHSPPTLLYPTLPSLVKLSRAAPHRILFS